MNACRFSCPPTLKKRVHNNDKLSYDTTYEYCYRRNYAYCMLHTLCLAIYCSPSRLTVVTAAVV